MTFSADGFADVLTAPLGVLAGAPCLLPVDDPRFTAWERAERDEAVAGLTLAELGFLSRYGPSLGACDRPLGATVGEWLARFAPPRADLGVEVGCGVGADLRLLRRFVRRVIGLDMAPCAVRCANAQLAGQRVPRYRRLEGRSYAQTTAWQLPPLSGWLVAVGDALGLPLCEEAADVVLALNLLDNVADPVGLLRGLSALLKPGGLLIVSSPFAWRDDLTPPESQLGGGTIPALVELGSAVAVAAILAGQTPLAPELDLEVLATSEVPWELEDHARCVVRYQVHALAARRRR